MGLGRVRKVISSAARWVGISSRFDYQRELQQLHRKLGGAVVCQIGANDGRSNDPIHPFIRANPEISGVLVEPQPEAFEKLQATYPAAVYPNLHLANVAVHPEDAEIAMYRIEPSFTPTFRTLYKPTANASGITSLDSDHVRQFLKKIAPNYFASSDVDACIEKILVPAMSIAQLKLHYAAPRFDIVQIDAEGFDAVLVGMILDASGEALPYLINFEEKHIKSAKRDAISARLRGMGYALHRHRGDMCALRPT